MEGLKEELDRIDRIKSGKIRKPQRKENLNPSSPQSSPLRGEEILMKTFPQQHPKGDAVKNTEKPRDKFNPSPLAGERLGEGS
ncbi:MAG: hypothetical protein O3A78_11225 [Nitrospinae bacterium]|jgi:hypothetical protein|nr:hypothetical protein [Nitrospinota bacterium]MDA1110359.1 hypothetical protein [Nitrospinota bacterium]